MTNGDHDDDGSDQLGPVKQAILDELALTMGDDWLRDLTGSDDLRYLRWIHDRATGKTLLEVGGCAAFGFTDDGKFASLMLTSPTTARQIIGSADRVRYRDVDLTDDEIREWAEAITLAEKRLAPNS